MKGPTEDDRVGLRIRALNTQPVRSKAEGGGYVLYWMVSNRRASWNFALDRALEQSRELGVPLLVFEPLRLGYEWASDRMHRFVMDGMRQNRRSFDQAGVRYFPFVERSADQGKGLLEALAANACLVVTDDWPHFFIPRMQAAAAKRLSVRLEAVDSVGLWPVWGQTGGYGKLFSRAYDFRRFLQKNLADALREFPAGDPFGERVQPKKAAITKAITNRWPEATDAWLKDADSLAGLAIDHSVAPVDEPGGPREGRRRMKSFIERHLDQYHDQRGDVSRPATSGLSPYLHFGHLSPHEVLSVIGQHEGWSTKQAGTQVAGSAGARLGWWGLGEGAETFLDQIVTWRELGFHRSAGDPEFGTYAGLPQWARDSLELHADDERPYRYTLRKFENAATHDELWNAAQRQLVREGVIHNYLRMLWGKKILHWSKSPKEALRIMLHLNNKYAVDGRDPNSVSGISWVLGLFDRAWGPERPVFGKIRYMTSDSTRRKMRVGAYLKRYAETPVNELFS